MSPLNKLYARLFISFALAWILVSIPLIRNPLAGEERILAVKNCSQFDYKLRVLDAKLNQIETRVERIKDKTSKVEIAQRQVGVQNVSHVAASLPPWIETFKVPHWSSFRPWRGVFVFFVTYRHEYLRACLTSISEASADIDKSSVCVFALDILHKRTTKADVDETIKVINNVTFCKVFVWKVDSDRGRPPEKNLALRLKHHWWFVLESVFNATMAGKGALRLSSIG